MGQFMNFMRNYVNIADGCSVGFNSAVLWITRIDTLGIDTMFKVNSVNDRVVFYSTRGGYAYDFQSNVE